MSEKGRILADRYELKELIGATRTNKNYSNLLVFEANFRKWIEDSIDNDKLKINCK